MPDNSLNRFILWLLTSLFFGGLCFGLILFDQYTKSYVMAHDELYNLDYFAVLRIFPAWNYGVSFGMGATMRIGQYIIILNCIIITVLCVWWTRLRDNPSRLSLIAVIAGAISNIYDRICYGAVFDFIGIHYQQYYFPIFNLADCFIVLGMVSLFYFKYR